MTLRIKFRDIFRATLSFRTGNESWIGIAPDGGSYHIVSPVDTQISKGVMACNRPSDGTPFGGYKGWVYFRVPPFFEDVGDVETARKEQALRVSAELVNKLERFGIQAIVEDTDQTSDGSTIEPKKESPEDALLCSKCGKTWNKLSACLRDEDLSLLAYRACINDFSKGIYVFEHKCGGSVNIPVSSFIRKPLNNRILAGLQACPGLCYYEHLFQECPAYCEGSCYRHVARKIYQRRKSCTKRI